MASAENDLIALLPRRDRLRLLAVSRSVQLVSGNVLCDPGKPTRYVYFPRDSCASLVTTIEDKPVLAVGMVGREGMLGAHLVLGVGAVPLHALVQGEGQAWRTEAAPFRRVLARSKPLQRVVNQYLYVLMVQLATSAACTRFHSVSPRLARWLLMSQDRAASDSFHLTQEFLAYMLGVRRVGITAAASSLQRRGLIRYHRGEITVRNRSGLEAAACACYAENRRAYSQILA